MVENGLRPADDASAGAVAAVELAAARAWPAPISERLGDWWLRSADGFTGRANSALTIGDSGLAPAEALAAVVAFYRALGHTPYIDVPMPLAQPIADGRPGREVDCGVDGARADGRVSRSHRAGRGRARALRPPRRSRPPIISPRWPPLGVRSGRPRSTC